MAEDQASPIAMQSLSVLQRRLALFAQTHDARHVIGPEAQADLEAAGALRYFVDADSKIQVNITAIAVIARFRLWHGNLSGGPAGSVEVHEAVTDFLFVRSAAPGLIPDEVADLVERLATSLAERLRWSNDHAEALMSVFDANGHVAALDRVIAILSDVHETPGLNAADRIRALSLLGRAHHERFLSDGHEPDGRIALSVRSEAAALSPEGRDRARRLSLLADTQLAVSDRTGEVSLLAGAIQSLEESIALTQQDNQFLWLRYQKLAGACQKMFEATHADADLDAAVEWGRRAYAAFGPAEQGSDQLLRKHISTLYDRYRHKHTRADLEEAVALWRAALLKIAAADARASTLHDGLSAALHRCYEDSGSRSDLDACIHACTDAIAAFDEGDEFWAVRLSNLCYLLRLRFEAGKDPADINESLRVGRLAVSALSPVGRDESSRTAFGNLLNADVASYDAVWDLSCLDEALGLLESLMATTDATGPEHAKLITDYLEVSQKRLEHTGAQADLDQVFRAARIFLDEPEPDFGAIAETLMRTSRFLDDHAEELVFDRPPNLGLELDNERFGLRSRNLTDSGHTAALVELARSAAPRSTSDNEEEALRRSSLALALAVRHRSGGTAADGAEAIGIMKEILATADPQNDQFYRFLGNLGSALTSRFLVEGDRADLDAAIDHLKQAVDSVPQTAADRNVVLSLLARALRLRYEAARDPDDLDRAATVVDEALAAGQPVSESREATLALAARSREWRFYHSRDPADLDAAVAAAREAVDLRRANGRDAVGQLALLARMLFTRYRQIGNAADLDDAIATQEQALTEGSETAANSPGIVQNRALFLYERALRSGSSADFDHCVAGLRATTELRSVSHLHRAADYHNLGSVLRDRYHYLGDPADLRDAREAHLVALDLVGTQDPLLRAITTVGLANVQAALFGVTNDPADLDEGISLAAAAEHEFPEHGDAMSALCSTLEWLLRMRVELPGETNLNDVAEMLRVSRKLVDSADSSTGAYRSLYLRSRAESLATAARILNDTELLNQAIATARKAVDLAENGDFRRSEFLWLLGGLLHERYQVLDIDSDLGEAVKCWREAARDESGAPRAAAQSAATAGRVALLHGDVAGALTDYSLAVSLLPTVAWLGMKSAVRRQSLRPWSPLPSEAAASAILAGRPEAAIELLEQSRTVLWTQTLHLRSDLTELAKTRPDLAQRLATLRNQLDVGPTTADRTHTPGPFGIQRPVPNDSEGERRRSIIRDWDETIQEVRRIDGFEHFLAPVPYTDLREAAANGPVVVVMTSAFGSYALIVRHSEPEPEVVPLVEVTPENVVAAAAGLREAASRQTDRKTPFLRREQARHAMHGLLEWLWDVIVEPVLARLDIPGAGSNEPPRLWWCPVGLLSLLPLHAAGHHPRHQTAPDTGRWTGNLVISSYTPTLAALSRGRSPRSASELRRHLAVAMPQTSGLSDLAAVHDELASLVRHASSAVEIVPLVGEEATREVVLEQLARCGRVHLACHAFQDPADPAESAFSLADGRLTITDIAELEIADAELAFLSACQTAAGDLQLPDEAIHLAAAVQLVGFRQIVATSWNVGDAAAATAADKFYAKLSRATTPDSVAAALHHAVGKLRDGDPTEPVRWASFVHFGP